ncbi:tetraacyldisaccharide 4'-kinase [Candidatus Methylopumilus universalis]|uniref:tetraacyldisaccharide 4'-kinase n=1 Tax=Candidatus Methylopumilus universalis TaxID=2588536 RepID=UPI003BEF1FDB
MIVYKALSKLHYSKSLASLFLLPLSAIYLLISFARKYLYRLNLLKSFKMQVPVIVIGNITSGGTGKTPLVIHLANELKKNGYHPGIISRGYGSKRNGVSEVNKKSDVENIGDEPILIHKHTHIPVFIAKDRVLAAKTLIKKYKKIDVILSDDGMQHYRLKRDMEILVIDGTRRFGNGYLLPAGPLRESKRKLKAVDAIVCNEKKVIDGSYLMKYKSYFLINLKTKKKIPLNKLRLKNLHAVAGIGNPNRFFNYLKALDLVFDSSSYKDHYRFTKKDFKTMSDKNIIMTEKDAIKCEKFARDNFWYLPVVVEIDSRFTDLILNKMKNIAHG